MKKPLIVIVALCLAMACQPKKEGQEAEVIETEATAAAEAKASLAYFGEKINENDVMNTDAFLKAMDGKDSLKVKLSGEILSSCKMKGCWMKVGLDDEQDMRVTFKDYDFFIPKDGVKGKETIFEGYAKLVETDVETLKHFAKDAGKSQEEIDQITSPKKEISFVASGVIIK